MGIIYVDGIPLRKLDREFDFPHATWFRDDVRDGALYSFEHGGLLPNNLFWNFLEARYEIDPHRFTHYHPFISELIRIDLEYKPPENPCSTETPPPHHVGSPHGTVPEPSSVFLMILGIVVSFIFFKRRLRSGFNSGQ